MVMVNRDETEMKYYEDPQTGKKFKLKRPETPWDRMGAILSFFFLLSVLIFLGYFLIKISLKQPPFRSYLEYFFGQQYADFFNSPLVRLMLYAAIGGGFGGAVSGIRSDILWHLELQAYGGRFIPKDIALPLLGAVLAFVVYVLVRGGFTVLSGNISQTDSGGVQAMWALSIGILSGYGSEKVFVWLQHLVQETFSVKKS